MLSYSRAVSYAASASLYLPSASRAWDGRADGDGSDHRFRQGGDGLPRLGRQGQAGTGRTTGRQVQTGDDGTGKVNGE